MFERIAEKVRGQRGIEPEEALWLLTEGELLPLGRLADRVRRRMHPEGRVSFVVDRNVNYTNVCESRCRFCAFYRSEGDADAYLLDRGEIIAKIEELVAQGGTQLLMQGGLHPALGIEFFEGLFREIKGRFPGVQNHSLSPAEITHIAKVSGLTMPQVLARLKEAGLDSVPGGGAEILVDRVRRKIAPLKGGADKWLEVMEAAHEEGMRSTGTMMFGITETLAERVEHFRVLREQQDRALARGNGGGHTAFVAWPFQSGHTVWEGKVPKPTDDEYLRTIAVARIYLDNFPHVQSSWVTMGRKTGQAALHYGCDDMGSLMLEENVVSAAGTCHSVNKDEMLRMIRSAGFEPWQRDNVYGTVDWAP